MSAALVKAAAYPNDLVLPAWPDPTADQPGQWLEWLRKAWTLPGFAAAVTPAAPGLAAQITRALDGRDSSVLVAPTQPVCEADSDDLKTAFPTMRQSFSVTPNA